ncbi:NADH-quinone oxidoreductase subunit H [archaeon]|nr:NADH-quinone oxidoreductase subunit H [archaeon]
MRSGSQMISYELSMGATFSAIILISGSFSLTDIVNMQEHI